MSASLSVDETNVWRKGGKLHKIDIRSGPFVGIDLGSSNCCVALWHPIKSRAKIVKNPITLKKITPSTVAFGDHFQDWVIGELTEEVQHPVTSCAKSIIGLEKQDVKEFLGGTSDYDFQIDKKCMLSPETLPPGFDVDANDKLALQCINKNGDVKFMAPEVVTAYILGFLKNAVEEYIKRAPFSVSEFSQWDGHLRRAVIGVPANFTERRKEATRRAAALAGFEEVHLMVESTAAAMSYGLFVAGCKEVMVFDMGGGSTDITIMRIDDGCFSVEACGGHTFCGGRNIDRLILMYVLKKIGFSSVQTRANVVEGCGDTDQGTSKGKVVFAEREVTNTVKGDSESRTSPEPTTTPTAPALPASATVPHQSTSSTTPCATTLNPVSIDDIQEPVRGKLLAACRLGKELLSEQDEVIITIDTKIFEGTNYVWLRRFSKDQKDDDKPAAPVPPVVVPSKSLGGVFNVFEAAASIIPVIHVKSTNSIHGSSEGRASTSTTAVAKATTAAVVKKEYSSNHDTMIRCKLTRTEYETIVAPVVHVVEATVRSTLQQWKTLKRRQQVKNHQCDGDAHPENKNERAGGHTDNLKAPIPATATMSAMIDEVVLVGGSSRALPVRDAIRRALHAEGYEQFAPGGSGEFCTSVDADHAVAQGLAIRGGILAGIDTGKLKDILMMDMLPTSIGVLSWGNGGADRASDKTMGLNNNSTSSFSADSMRSSSSSSSLTYEPAASRSVTEYEVRYFEPVLFKGDRIPAKGVKTFTLASAHQKFVSLDIYEEIEEYRNQQQPLGGHRASLQCRSRSSSSSSAPVAAAIGEDSSVKDAMSLDFNDVHESRRYHHQLIATYDFAVPLAARKKKSGAKTTSSAGDMKEKDDDLPKVDVVFTMSQEGLLGFAVRAHGEDGEKQAEDEISMQSLFILGAYLAILVVLYAVVKTAILSPDSRKLIRKFSQMPSDDNEPSLQEKI